MTPVAVAKGAAAGGSTLTLIKGALTIMAWTKVKTAVVAGVVVLLVGGTTTITIKKIEQHQADDSWRTINYNSRVLERTSPQVIEILPAKLPRGGGYGLANDKRMGTGVDAETVVRMAYEFWSPVRTILSTELPKDKYDFIASLPDRQCRSVAAGNEKIAAQFGVTARRETIATNVWLLRTAEPKCRGFATNKGNPIQLKPKKRLMVISLVFMGRQSVA